MFASFGYLLLTLITFNIVIALHEMGHYLAARMFCVQIINVSIGVGKIIWEKSTKTGTKWQFKLIPFAGYVSLADTRYSQTKLTYARTGINLISKWKRTIIICAGIGFNFIAAFAIFWLIFSLGVPSLKPIIGKITPNSIAAHAGLQVNDQIIAVDKQKVKNWEQVIQQLLLKYNVADEIVLTIKPPVKKVTLHTPKTQWEFDKQNPKIINSLGIHVKKPIIPPIIDKVIKSSPAHKAEIQPGDKIISIDDHPITSWSDMQKIIKPQPNQVIKLKLYRKSLDSDITISIKLSEQYGTNWSKIGYLGVHPVLIHDSSFLLIEQYPWTQSWYISLQYLNNFVYSYGLIIYKLCIGKLPITILSGPIGILQTTIEVLQLQQIILILKWFAILNISIGMINILPIPGLDGGHLIFLLVETIIRKPIPIVYEYLFSITSLFIVCMLILYISVSDVNRIFY